MNFYLRQSFSGKGRRGESTVFHPKKSAESLETEATKGKITVTLTVLPASLATKKGLFDHKISRTLGEILKREVPSSSQPSIHTGGEGERTCQLKRSPLGKGARLN